MGRAPCCDKATVKRGPWSPEEDAVLRSYIQTNGTGGNWIALPQKAGLKRCGKSCRLRWLNYLRPDIKHGGFTEEEDTIILSLYSSMGSRWSVIASHLPGRTDNDVKNYWNTRLKKKMASTQTQARLASANIDTHSAAYILHSPSSQVPPLPLVPNSGYGYTPDPQRLFWELSQLPPMGVCSFDAPYFSSTMASTVLPPMEDVPAAASSTTTTMDNSGSTSSSFTNWCLNGVGGGGGADDWLLSELGFGQPTAPLDRYGSPENATWEADPCYSTTTPTSNMWVAQETNPQGMCQSVIYS